MTQMTGLGFVETFTTVALFHFTGSLCSSRVRLYSRDGFARAGQCTIQQPTLFKLSKHSGRDWQSWCGDSDTTRILLDQLRKNEKRYMITLKCAAKKRMREVV